MDSDQKLALLAKLGLKPSENFGKPRGKVYRRKTYLQKVQGAWKGYDGVSDTSIKNLKASRKRRP